MAFGLSFSEEFFTGDDGCDCPEPSDRPTNVRQALASMSDDKWNEMVKEVFPDRDPECVDLDDVMTKVRQTDTCGDMSTPVVVWIDSEGFYTVDVYDALDSE